MADNVLTFRPRPKPAVAPPSVTTSQAEIRTQLEQAAQVALDTADRIIAVLDHLDGDPDLEDGGDAEPSLGAPEHHEGSQVTWLRGNDQDHEAEAPEIALSEVTNDEQPGAIVLPWRGRGNCITAAGQALLDLVGG